MPLVFAKMRSRTRAVPRLRESVWGLAQPTASAFWRVVLLVMCAVISAVIGITQVRVGLFLSTPVNLTSRIAGRRKHGAMAQLVAHLLCKQGVRGSSPLSSTHGKPPTHCEWEAFGVSRAFRPDLWLFCVVSGSFLAFRMRVTALRIRSNETLKPWVVCWWACWVGLRGCGAFLVSGRCAGESSHPLCRCLLLPRPHISLVRSSDWSCR